MVMHTCSVSTCEHLYDSGIRLIQSGTPVMKERIKVDGKAGQLGDKVSVSKEGEGKLVVTANGPFSKRYLKYLTKVRSLSSTSKMHNILMKRHVSRNTSRRTT